MKNKSAIFVLLLTVFCVLSAKGNDIESTINLDADDIAVDDSSNRIYAVKSSSSQVQVVDGILNTLLNSISLNNSASPVIAVNPKTGFGYIKSRSAGVPGVSVINVQSGVDTGIFIPIEGSVDDIEVDSLSNKIYVIGVLLKEGKVRLIDGDTNTIVDTLSISENANQLSEIAVCSKDKAVAIDGPSGTVHILKVNKNKLSVEGTVIVDNQKAGNSIIACNSATNKAYAAGTNTNDDTLHVINVETQMLVESIPVDSLVFSNGGNGISDIAVDSTTNKIYVAQNDNLTDSIVVLDGNSNDFDENTEFSSNVTFSEIKINSVTNKVYVLDDSKNTLTVIGGSLNPPHSLESENSSEDNMSSNGMSSSGGEEVSVDNVRDEGNEFLQVLDLFLQLKDKLDEQSKITKVNNINRKVKKVIPQLQKLEKKVNELLELETVIFGSPIREEAKLCSVVLKSAIKLSGNVVDKIESLSCSASAGVPTCVAVNKVDEIITAGENILRKTENISSDEDKNGLPDLCDYIAVMKGLKGK